jgi:hypothetical protein
MNARKRQRQENQDCEHKGTHEEKAGKEQTCAALILTHYQVYHWLFRSKDVLVYEVSEPERKGIILEWKTVKQLLRCRGRRQFIPTALDPDRLNSVTNKSWVVLARYGCLKGDKQLYFTGKRVVTLNERRQPLVVSPAPSSFPKVSKGLSSLSRL